MNQRVVVRGLDRRFGHLVERATVTRERSRNRRYIRAGGYSDGVLGGYSKIRVVEL